MKIMLRVFTTKSLSLLTKSLNRCLKSVYGFIFFVYFGFPFNCLTICAWRVNSTFFLASIAVFYYQTYALIKRASRQQLEFPESKDAFAYLLLRQ